LAVLDSAPDCRRNAGWKTWSVTAAWWSTVPCGSISFSFGLQSGRGVAVALDREPHPATLPAAVFERLFDHVFAQCVTAGLVTGHTQAVDSAFVKANALLVASRHRFCPGFPAAVRGLRVQQTAQTLR
jgi:hypothetical protein